MVGLIYPQLCFEWGFKQTFPRNQDVAVQGHLCQILVVFEVPARRPQVKGMSGTC